MASVEVLNRRPQPRLLQVIRTCDLSSGLRRITLSGSQLRGFPEHRNGAHIKLFFPRIGQRQPVLPALTERGIVWPQNQLKAITRTYSVRRYCAQHNELDIDFVMHGHDSPAAGWAKRARPGDYLGVAGPGGPDPLLAPADWHIIAGDMSALPAISALLEQLSMFARGYVFIEVDRAEHIQPLHNNTGLQIHWVQRDGVHSMLEDVKHTVRPPRGAQSLSGFVAGENGLVRSMRDYLRETYRLTRKELYAVPYWCRGQDEEAYHQQRHEIMDQVY